MEYRQAVRSEIVKGCSRRYFFDMFTSVSGNFLVITESRMNAHSRKRASIMVWPEDAELFLAAIQESIAALRAESDN
jgi:hypothetical protein